MIGNKLPLEKGGFSLGTSLFSIHETADSIVLWDANDLLHIIYERNVTCGKFHRQHRTHRIIGNTSIRQNRF